MKKYINIVILAVSVLYLVGCGDAGSKKWQLNNKNLTQEEVATLKLAIAMKDDYIKKGAKWSEADGYFFSEMLKYFPEYAKECDKVNGWSKFDGSNWRNLLSEETRFEKKCDENQGWKLMSPDDWVSLLSIQPKYKSKADEYKAWDKFTSKDWAKILLSKNDILVEKCHSLNVLQKFNKNEWVSLLLADASFIGEADKNEIWKQLKNDDWSKLIGKDDKFIDIAKREKIFDTFDNDTWLAMIEANPKLQKVAEDNGVFKKFTPIDWANLLAKDPKYMSLFKSVSSLDKLSNRSLIRLYCEQPSLRNEIFALNRIDIDVAKKIDNIYNNFGDNGSSLDANSLVAILKIFPELKKNINEQTFQNYDEKNWIKLLGGDKEIYDVVSEKYAYIVPWKKFTFEDWCVILDKNTDITKHFKSIIDLKKLDYQSIKKALLKASLLGLDVFEKYNFWKDFTKEQYIALIKDEGAELIGMSSIVEQMSGKRIRSQKDLNGAVIRMEEEQNVAIDKMLSGDLSGGISDIKNVAEKVKSGIVYDYKYIISMAAKNKILEQFTADDWKDLCKDDFQRTSYTKKENINKAREIEKEYFKIHESDFSKVIPEFLSFDNVKELNLWNKLSEKQFIDINPYVMVGKERGPIEDLDDARSFAQLSEFLSKINEYNLWKRFSKDDQVKLLKLSIKYNFSNEQIDTLPIWKNQISSEVWMQYFMLNNGIVESVAKYCDWKNFKSSDIVTLIKSISQKIDTEIASSGNGNKIRLINPKMSKIFKNFDINRLTVDELFECLKINPYSAMETKWVSNTPEKIKQGFSKSIPVKTYPSLLKDFSAKQWIELINLHKQSEKFFIKNLFSKNATIESYSEDEKSQLKSVGFDIDKKSSKSETRQETNANMGVKNNTTSTSMPIKEESNVSKKLKKELNVLGF